MSRAVEQLRARAIGDARASEILGAAARVKSRFALAPTTTTIPPAPVTQAPKDDDKGNGKGKGSGKD